MFNWSRWLAKDRSQARKHKGFRVGRRPSFRPQVEQLESRLTPTAISTLTTLATFAASPSPEYPEAGLVENASGDFFGTTGQGGASGDGTVFELPAGSTTLATLASFNGTNGSDPVGTLIEDSSGNFFGTTNTGGTNDAGTVFEVAKGSSTITALASFSASSGYPLSGLVEDASGDLFGDTSDNVIFEVKFDTGAITNLASFNANTTGTGSLGNLVLDASGDLFGNTYQSGPNGNGTIFELPKGSSTITALTAFAAGSGAHPLGGLVADSSGNLFGTISAGGTNGDGSVFELAKGSSTITTLATFNGTNGSLPFGTLVDAGGNLFGTSSGGVFEVKAGSGAITALASFTAGDYPEISTNVTEDTLVRDGSGNLFGTTETGGNGYGRVFELASGSVTITLEPTNQTDAAGISATFTAAATGSPSPSVQWELSTNNGSSFTAIPGATSTSYSFTTTADDNGYEYEAVFTSGLASASTGAVTLTVDSVTITSSPTSQTVTAGNSVTFTAAASGKPSPTVQWELSTNGGSSFGNISGATSASYSFSFAAAADNGYEYEAVFTSGLANATTVAATLTVDSAPTITIDPTSQTVTAGNSVTFTASATGNPAPTVQWEVSTNAGSSFSDISGATLTSYSFTTGSSDNGAEYEAVFTSSVGSATTTAAALTVEGTAPEVFIIGTNQQIYYQQFGANGVATTGFIQSAPGFALALAAGDDSTGPELFVIGTNHEIYYQQLNADGTPLANASFQQSAQGFAVALAVGSDSIGPELFVIGTNHEIYYQQLNASGAPLANPSFQQSAPGFALALAVGTDSAGPELFVIGTNHEIYYQQLNGNGTPLANPSFQQSAPGFAVALAVGTDSTGPELFVIGTNQEIYYQQLDSTGAPLANPSFEQSASGFAVALAVGTDSTGPELFIIGTNQEIYSQQLNDTGAPLSNPSFQQTAPGFALAIAVTDPVVDAVTNGLAGNSATPAALDAYFAAEFMG